MWKRDADAEYREKHIEGALRFDFSKIRDTSHPMPLMLPKAEIFEEKVREVYRRMTKILIIIIIVIIIITIIIIIIIIIITVIMKSTKVQTHGAIWLKY